jgi:hypothetical protein
MLLTGDYAHYPFSVDPASRPVEFNQPCRYLDALAEAIRVPAKLVWHRHSYPVRS